MKLIPLIIILVWVSMVIAYIQTIPMIANQQTRDLCREYANRDHEKEIAPERWRVYGEDFKKFDWYKSCLRHSGLE